MHRAVRQAASTPADILVGFVALDRLVALTAVAALVASAGCKRAAEAPARSPAAVSPSGAALGPASSPPAPDKAHPGPENTAPEHAAKLRPGAEVAAGPAGEPATAPEEGRAPEPPPAAPAAQACRALVLVATSSPAAAAGDEAPEQNGQPYTTLDVRLGAETTVKQAPGLLVRADGKTWGLQITRSEVRGKEGRYEVVDTWDRLDAVDLAGGGRATWFEEREYSAEAAKGLNEDDDEMGAEGFDAQSQVSVVGVVGPVVSFFHESTGFGGGAHGYDNTLVTARQAPGGGPVDVTTWAPDLAAAAAKEAKAVEARRASGEGGFEASSVTPEVLARAGLGLDPANWMAGPLDDGETAERASRALGLTVYTRVECCSWAENHNLMDLSIAVGLSDALAAQVGRPDPANKRLMVAPDGCGAVGFGDGKLLTRSGAAGEASAYELNGVTVAGLLGIYWIAGDDPVDITQLPAPVVSGASAALAGAVPVAPAPAAAPPAGAAPSGAVEHRAGLLTYKELPTTRSEEAYAGVEFWLDGQPVEPSATVTRDTLVGLNGKQVSMDCTPRTPALPGPTEQYPVDMDGKPIPRPVRCTVLTVSASE